MVKHPTASLAHHTRLSVFSIRHLIKAFLASYVMPSILINPLSPPIVSLKPLVHKFLTHIRFVRYEFVNSVRFNPYEVFWC